MARLLTQLFHVTEQFDMKTQPQLILLQKTMVVVEGVARTLNPNLNMWTASEPVVRAWIEEKLGPQGRISDAAEGAAGNISVCIGWPIEIRRRFPVADEIILPVPAPRLVGQHVIVTGSGRRLRDIAADPVANLGVVRIEDGGTTGTLLTSPSRLFERLTVEWNSHLAVHDDTVARTGTNFHAVVHAQPPHLTYLSHVPAYQDEERFSRRLLRWEAETIVNLPAGIGVLPFMLLKALQEATARIETLEAEVAALKAS